MFLHVSVVNSQRYLLILIPSSTRVQIKFTSLSIGLTYVQVVRRPFCLYIINKVKLIFLHIQVSFEEKKMSIMLLINFDPLNDLYNGTRWYVEVLIIQYHACKNYDGLMCFHACAYPQKLNFCPKKIKNILLYFFEIISSSLLFC